MDFAKLLKSVREIFQDAPILVLMLLLAGLIAVLIIIDAHRTRKERPRHRGTKDH